VSASGGINVALVLVLPGFEVEFMLLRQHRWHIDGR
jgi:hypothetical protein